MGLSLCLTKINSTSLRTRDGEMSLTPSSSSIGFLKQHPECKELINPVKVFEETKLVDEFVTNSGTLVEDGLVYRQNVAIRSYEIGADGRVTLEAMMSHLQEVGLNHMKLIGLLGDGLGSTPEIAKRLFDFLCLASNLFGQRGPRGMNDHTLSCGIV